MVDAAVGVDGLSIVLHGGGLWPEPTQLPEEARNYIRLADAKVASISGQPYGEAYRSGLLSDPTMTLESLPTTAAVLAAEAIEPSTGLEMLKGIQHAHYEQGRRVVESEVLLKIATEIGLDAAAFEAALESVDAAGHISDTRRLMHQVGAQGFPTFLLEIQGQWFAVPNREFAADPSGFADWLERMINEHASLTG